MSLLEVRFFADTLLQQVAMNVILPSKPEPFPVLYLLHGLSEDHSAWIRRSSIERYVENLHLAVAMPSCLRGWYCNDDRVDGRAYEDHIVKDVVGFMDKTFHTIPHRGGRAIAGESMGGYGAMMLALRHPDVFSVTSSLCGAFSFMHSSAPDWIDKYKEIYSPQKYDVFELAKKASAAEPLAIRIDCGHDDFLVEPNRQFHQHLQDLNIPHEYHESDGAHDWDFCDPHIRDTVAFVMKNLTKE